MTSLHRLAPAAVWLAMGMIAPLAHATDPAGAPPNPADANASVPATSYQSALPYRLAATDNTSPAQHWKALNQQVAAYDSMALTMGDASDRQADAVSPETGAAAPAAAPAPDPHAHHRKKEAQ